MTTYCEECGNPMYYKEGWEYCPECDTETYFVGDDD